MSRKCKVCVEIINGRSDKVFCSVRCKNIYHKEIYNASKIASKEINGYLDCNHSILLEFLGNDKNEIKVLRRLLKKKGFRFKYHTHSELNSENKLQHYVYDVAWVELSEDKILILKN